MSRCVLEELLEHVEVDKHVKDLMRALQVYNIDNLIIIKDFINLLIIVRKTKEEC